MKRKKSETSETSATGKTVIKHECNEQQPRAVSPLDAKQVKEALAEMVDDLNVWLNDGFPTHESLNKFTDLIVQGAALADKKKKPEFGELSSCIAHVEKRWSSLKITTYANRLARKVADAPESPQGKILNKIAKLVGTSNAITFDCPGGSSTINISGEKALTAAFPNHYKEMSVLIKIHDALSHDVFPEDNDGWSEFYPALKEYAAALAKVLKDTKPRTMTEGDFSEKRKEFTSVFGFAAFFELYHAQAEWNQMNIEPSVQWLYGLDDPEVHKHISRHMHPSASTLAQLREHHEKGTDNLRQQRYRNKKPSKGN